MERLRPVQLRDGEVDVPVRTTADAVGPEELLVVAGEYLVLARRAGDADGVVRHVRIETQTDSAYLRLQAEVKRFPRLQAREEVKLLYGDGASEKLIVRSEGVGGPGVSMERSRILVDRLLVSSVDTFLDRIGGRPGGHSDFEIRRSADRQTIPALPPENKTASKSATSTGWTLFPDVGTHYSHCGAPNYYTLCPRTSAGSESVFRE